MKNANTIKTATIYYDIEDRQHYSREGAIKANIKHRNDWISRSTESKVEKILLEAENLRTYGRELKFDRVARYLIETDLLKAHKKIKQLQKESELEYSKFYTKTVLK